MQLLWPSVRREIQFSPLRYPWAVVDAQWALVFVGANKQRQTLTAGKAIGRMLGISLTSPNLGQRVTAAPFLSQ